MRRISFKRTLTTCFFFRNIKDTEAEQNSETFLVETTKTRFCQSISHFVAFSCCCLPVKCSPPENDITYRMLSDRLGEKFQFLLELVLYLYYKIPKGSARYKPPLKSLSKNVSERVLAKQKNQDWRAADLYRDV